MRPGRSSPSPLAPSSLQTVRFVEAKELVGGYSVYELVDLAEANQKAQAFLQTHLDTWPGWEGWVEVRQLMEQPSPP